VRSRIVAAGLAGLALAGCKDRRPPSPTPVPSGSATLAPDPVASARRPVRRYYLAHTAKRCEIYAVDPDRVSPSVATPCPIDLEIGERIRITGKTCIREGGGADRVEPVVCPDPLTYFEKKDRAEKP